MMLPFFRRGIHHRIEDAIRRGVGVSEASWPVPGTLDDAARDAIVQGVVDWVCSSMSAMRRPYGIDHIALALACRDASGRIVCSNSLGVIRPAVFYGGEGSAGIAAFLRDLESVPPGHRTEVAAALLCVGDLAYELGAAA